MKTSNRFLVLIILPVCFIFNCSSLDMHSSEILNQADAQFDEGSYGQAIALYNEAAEKARGEGNNNNVVEAYSQIARCYLKQDSLDQGKIWLAKAEELASDDEPGGWSRFLGVRGRFEWKEASAETGELAPESDAAAATFTGMYEYSIANDLFERAIDAANMMTIVGNKDTRIEWGAKGIEAAERGGYDSWLAVLWNNLGWNYDAVGNPDKALEALKKARDYHYKGDKELPRLIADWSVGYAFRKAGELDSAQAVMGKVHSWADSLYSENPSEENAEWLGFSLKELGEIALMDNRGGDALNYLKDAEAKLTEANMGEWDSEGLQKLKSSIDKLESSE
jgi:tetratricopeptide (TPR) repeat protein